MALVFEKCAAWARVCCSHIVALHCMQCHAGIPSIASCHFPQPFSQFGCLQGIIWVHCASSTASTPVLARYWHCIPQDCQPVALHCFSLPIAGITFSCQVIEWHCNFICCHWVALHFQTLPANGSAYVNGFASTSGFPHAMPQCFCLYGIHVVFIYTNPSNTMQNVQ